MGSKFSSVLELLERYSTRHYLDIHLASHILNLVNLIKNRAIVLYFQPFTTIRMDRMSRAFGWTVAQLEDAVVGLIQTGEIQARLDKQNKVSFRARARVCGKCEGTRLDDADTTWQILKAKETDQRAQLFQRTLKSGNEMLSANRKLLLRMRLYVFS